NCDCPSESYNSNKCSANWQNATNITDTVVPALLQGINGELNKSTHYETDTPAAFSSLFKLKRELEQAQQALGKIEDPRYGDMVNQKNTQIQSFASQGATFLNGACYVYLKNFNATSGGAGFSWCRDNPNDRWSKR